MRVGRSIRCADAVDLDLNGMNTLEFAIRSMTGATRVQTANMKTNVFSPRQSRYILVEDELQQCLEEMYPGYEFNIQVCSSVVFGDEAGKPARRNDCLC